MLFKQQQKYVDHNLLGVYHHISGVSRGASVNNRTTPLSLNCSIDTLDRRKGCYSIYFQCLPSCRNILKGFADLVKSLVVLVISI